MPESSSGVGESSRGIGSASLLEVLNRGRIHGLEIPAACASHGAAELLGVEQNPQQYVCVNVIVQVPALDGKTRSNRESQINSYSENLLKFRLRYIAFLLCACLELKCAVFSRSFAHHTLKMLYFPGFLRTLHLEML